MSCGNLTRQTARASSSHLFRINPCKSQRMVVSCMCFRANGSCCSMARTGKNIWLAASNRPGRTFPGRIWDCPGISARPGCLNRCAGSRRVNSRPHLSVRGSRRGGAVGSQARPPFGPVAAGLRATGAPSMVACANMPPVIAHFSVHLVSPRSVYAVYS